MNKKLQVFVSSTYTDLIEERQAAVEAILDAGHIPAGMELFKAGNESQLKTIYKWIDESDVYMLILGGRYGSFEPNSDKSYTQLEYEYAISKNIPVFAVVLSDSFLTQKISNLGFKNATEQIAPDKYQTFKSLVMSKIIREVDDCKDIKINIHSTLNDFMHDYDLVGWVRNNNGNDTIQLIKDNNALTEENNILNKQFHEIQIHLNTKSKKQFGKYSFEELCEILKNKIYVTENIPYKKITSLNYFISHYSDFCSTNGYDEGLYECCKFLESFNLVKEYVHKFNFNKFYDDCYFKISKHGVIFMMLLEKNNTHIAT